MAPFSAVIPLYLIGEWSTLLMMPRRAPQSKWLRFLSYTCHPSHVSHKTISITISNDGLLCYELYQVYSFPKTISHKFILQYVICQCLYKRSCTVQLLCCWLLTIACLKERFSRAIHYCVVGLRMFHSDLLGCLLSKGKALFKRSSTLQLWWVHLIKPFRGYFLLFGWKGVLRWHKGKCIFGYFVSVLCLELFVNAFSLKEKPFQQNVVKRGQYSWSLQSTLSKCHTPELPQI